MKLVCISDTHLEHDFAVPPGDVLIHAGDATNQGTEAEVWRFAEWFHALPFKHKIFVPGNHDFLFMEKAPLARTIMQAEGLHVLIDQPVTIEDYEFYGSPWVPRFGDWAFMKSEWALENHYLDHPIPRELDVLITHGPPFQVLDRLSRGEEVGSKALDRALAELWPNDDPMIHVFGHIHTGHGLHMGRKTLSINAAIQPEYGSERFYAGEKNSPIVVEI